MLNFFKNLLGMPTVAEKEAAKAAPAPADQLPAVKLPINEPAAAKPAKAKKPAKPKAPKAAKPAKSKKAK